MFQYWNILALDGSNWQRVDLFDFQVDVKVSLQLTKDLLDTLEPFVPRHEKTNVLVSDLIGRKPSCTATEDG